MGGRSAPAVLHLTAAVGGGADRYIRDAACASGRRHFIWHAGGTIDVIEDIDAHAFVPLRDVASAPGASAAIAAWCGAERVGLVHLHGVDRAARARLAMIGTLPAIATLHDVGFLAPDAFQADGMPQPDAAWIAEVRAGLARIEALIVPSAFIRREAERTLGVGTILIAPGIAPDDVRKPSMPAPAEFTARASRRVVAVVGAIGPHKGSELLAGLSRELAASDVSLVVVGYTNERIARGWSRDACYFVHGPYVDSQLHALLAAYRVDVVLFPNRLPESFSYALSEVWAARVPVIVPDAGALGERVARHGGGWRLSPLFDAADAAALIRRLFDADGERERARVKSQIDPFDTERIPTLASMSRALDTLYERFAVPAQPTSEGSPTDALAPLLAANLDGFAFRAELLHFAEDLDNARQAIADLQQALAQAQQWAQTAEANGAAWASKLERDIDSLKREIAARDDVLNALPAPLRGWLLKRARK